MADMKSKIDFDPTNNRFMIYTPMWMLDVVRAIPNRRWLASKQAWAAPAIRMNVAYLRERFPFAQAEWTPAAKKAAEDITKPAKAKVEPFPPSFAFHTSPMEHQRRALNKAWAQQDFALFMEMGTGKTKVAIDLMSARYRNKQIDAVLVVCPISIKSNWAEELAKHCGIPYEVRTLDLDKKTEIQWLHAKDGHLRWLIVGIESVQSSSRAMDMLEEYVKYHNVAMLVDESSRIKNPQAIRAKRCCDLGKRCKTRLIMTGTPITQGMIDLYMQFEFLNPQIIGIGDWYSFRNRYAVMGGYEAKQIIGYQNVEELMEIIRPYVFEVTKEDALPDLPPKVYETRTVQLNPEQKKIYRDLKAGLMAETEGKIIEPKNVLEKLLRMQQVVGGFYSVPEEDRFTHEMVTKEYDIPGKNPKVEALLEAVEEIRGKAIVWCRYRREIHYVVTALRAQFGAGAVVEFHGGVDEDGRTRARRRFQDDPDCRYFVGTAAAGGLGLTLTAANNVIYYSNSFSLEERLQSEDRAHRKGQEHKVTYIDLVAEGTIDRLVLQALRAKQDLAHFVRDAIREGTIKTAIRDQA